MLGFSASRRARDMHGGMELLGRMHVARLEDRACFWLVRSARGCWWLELSIEGTVPASLRPDEHGLSARRQGTAWNSRFTGSVSKTLSSCVRTVPM
jgi:hypothetical protein